MASARAAGATVTQPRPKRRPAEAPVRKAPPRSTPKPRKAAAAPQKRARAKARARSRTGIAWIMIGGLLLAGVVFVNLAVLRLNLRLDSATQARSKLRAENHALQSQLSSALASPRIQARAHSEDGLVQADPTTIGYIDLAKG